ncbi:DUF2252 domain-containing protein [Streptomyces roseoverticillatus]|uniref:DUF2252 domain-containing protein n=1 Tax=Streptomyces roseoverticillatus TaxID=66429 RepID=A0ABV3IP65_9ACTN
MKSDTPAIRRKETAVSAQHPHPSPHERAARGKAARGRMPRSAHAEPGPGTGRTDPVEVLEQQSADRVPELVPLRYGRMLESPFAFYRGAAAVMAADLGAQPRTGIEAQLCGDAHLLNFGLFASPERHLVFDVNDFDETLPGPWEWDVKRLAASMAIAARENDVPEKRRGEVVRGTVRAYREAMRGFAGMRNLDVWYAHFDTEQLRVLFADRLGKQGRRRMSRALETARGRDHLHAFQHLTVVVDGTRRIAADPPLLVPLGDLMTDDRRAELEGRLRVLVERYGRSLASDRRHLLHQFRMADAARKVVGVGSVGTRCWIVLMLGRDDDDPLILQAKEAGPSVLAPFAGPSPYGNEGQRVVCGQRLMQAVSDILLGWERAAGIDGRQRDFYVRQLRDWKGSARPETMPPGRLQAYGELCGATLARAHARSGDRIAIAAYLGGGDAFERALAEFAEAYADRNERDFRALAEAVRSGRVAARRA